MTRIVERNEEEFELKAPGRPRAGTSSSAARVCLGAINLRGPSGPIRLRCVYVPSLYTFYWSREHSDLRGLEGLDEKSQQEAIAGMTGATSAALAQAHDEVKAGRPADEQTIVSIEGGLLSQVVAEL